MAARLFPRQPRIVAAVTGTSGKTSVAAFTRQIWTALGHRAASIGTIGVVSPRGATYGSLTTPDPVALHRTLDALAGDEITHLAIEASSHGLDQYRLDGLHIAAGAFTNITRDHLDYHLSFEAYFAAKLRLILIDRAAPRSSMSTTSTRRRSSPPRRHAAFRLSAWDVAEPASGFWNPPGMDSRKPCGSITAADSLACDCRWSASFRWKTRWSRPGSPSRPAAIQPRCSRRLNTSSAPRAGSNSSALAAAARRFSSTTRTSRTRCQGADALRPYTRGRLIVVFGAGGDRDRGKRPLMGAVAAAKADRIIVTDDNPRSEDAAAIRAAIIAAAPGAIEIGDRHEAIRSAIADLGAGDVLLIAGKGHETGQIIGDRVVPFSDQEAVAAALKELAA